MVPGAGDAFRRDGYVIVRGVIGEPDISRAVARLRELAGDKERWTLPDGVNRHSEFWPIIFNERLLTAVREALGPDVRYLPHNDLHVGFSSFSWHRDSVNRGDGVGPDWVENAEPYRLARVGLYLQAFGDSRFRLGLVPGSHRAAHERDPGVHRRLRRRTSAVASVIAGLTGLDFVGSDATWVATGPGDAVIFDPRILHTGSRFDGDKYAVFIAYGVENMHFRRHWHYYRHLRKDLRYSSIDPQLADQLRAAGLLAQEPPPDLAVPDAWLPSPAYTFVARRFK